MDARIGDTPEAWICFHIQSRMSLLSYFLDPSGLTSYFSYFPGVKMNTDVVNTDSNSNASFGLNLL